MGFLDIFLIVVLFAPFCTAPLGLSVQQFQTPNILNLLASKQKQYYLIKIFTEFLTILLPASDCMKD
jgi:hypothetical protein